MKSKKGYNDDDGDDEIKTKSELSPGCICPFGGVRNG